MLGDAVIHLSYPLAFAAGVVSFLSPCVLPLLPAYLAYLGGRVGDTVMAGAPGGVVPGRGGAAAVAISPSRARPQAPLLANGIAFVLGFTAVFVVIFYVFEAVGVTLLVSHRRTVEVVCGALITLFGLNTLGVLRVGVLMRDLRVHLDGRRAGLGGAFLLGVTFAAGWSPCIGPQLGLILTVAAQRDFAGFPVMLTYAAGLAVPFLAAAILADRAQGAVRALNRHIGAVNLAAGFVLVVFGILLALGDITSLNRFGAPVDL
ncbi:MAG TPA: cytochrome c biogenesis protein CcdA [Candidatus Dormibacteraeota bacterium]|nr:cytochrome c biogenesis protein CcdA [Candidatus Dormibacteraeota bacterium]